MLSLVSNFQMTTTSLKPFTLAQRDNGDMNVIGPILGSIFTLFVLTNDRTIIVLTIS